VHARTEILSTENLSACQQSVRQFLSDARSEILSTEILSACQQSVRQLLSACPL